MSQIECGFDSNPDGQGSALLMLSGPTLAVNIGFDSTWLPTLTTPPAPGVSGVNALVDTGASISCIDQLLAASLNLPIVDRQTISGSAGAHPVNMHLAQIHVPSLNFTQYGIFAAVDLKGGGQAHEALIGRTFLFHFHMVYVGKSGAVTLTHTP